MFDQDEGAPKVSIEAMSRYREQGGGGFRGCAHRRNRAQSLEVIDTVSTVSFRVPPCIHTNQKHRNAVAETCGLAVQIRKQEPSTGAK